MKAQKKRERLTLNLDMSGGVDMTSHPQRVGRSRASYMKNIIYDGGVNRKRKGVHQIFSFLDENDRPLRINGIHSYLFDGNETVIIHAGKRFYRENGEMIPSSAEITDTLSSVFQLEGKLYIVGCGGFLVYDGEKISRAEPYIPVLYSGYDTQFEADSEVEKRNLLSPYGSALYCGRLLKENIAPYFQFPKAIDDAGELVAYVTISGVNNTLYACIGNTRDPDADTKINYPVTAKFVFSSKELGHGRSTVCEDIIAEGGKVYILDAEASTNTFVAPTMYLSRSGRTFYFNFNPESECPEDMNIRLEYRIQGTTDSPIEGCTFGEIIQDNRGQSRLVLSGNPLCPSRIFFSDGISGKGPLYFPEDCAVYVDRDSPVTAFLKLSKTYLGVFKRDKFFRYAFYHYPEAKDPSERYYINGYESRDTQGCINPYVSGRGGSDLLIFDGEGVWGIEEVSLETDKTYLSERSRNIKKGLLSHKETELLSSCACMYKGRYYLFIGGKVYIADTGRTFFDRELSPHTQYEWWLWDNIPARCVGTVNGEMYIGDTLGGVSALGNDYRDIRIVKKTKRGDVHYSAEEGLFTLNPLIIPDESTFVKLSGECSFLEKGEFSAFIHTSAGKTRTVILPAYPSPRTASLPRVRIIMTDGESIECSLALYGDDEALGTFSLVSSEGELLSPPPEGMDSVRIIDEGGREYALRRFGNKFATYEGDEAVCWYSLPVSPTLTVYRYANVECAFASPLLDLDAPARKKSLYRIGILGESESGGTVSFGYETEGDKLSVPVTGAGFNLDALDLNGVSFSLPLGRPYERRVYERNFSNILFFYSSADSSDCCVRSIYAVYTINNYINGVR